MSRSLFHKNAFAHYKNYSELTAVTVFSPTIPQLSLHAVRRAYISVTVGRGGSTGRGGGRLSRGGVGASKG
jgi:hypothetical protein